MELKRSVRIHHYLVLEDHWSERSYNYKRTILIRDSSGPLAADISLFRLYHIKTLILNLSHTSLAKDNKQQIQRPTKRDGEVEWSNSERRAVP